MSQISFAGLHLSERIPDETTILNFRHLLEAPSSTKNKERQRDVEMHQTKKGNQWHFGMKLHIGVDADTGLVHSAVGTSGNEHDITQADKLLHGHEKRVHGDAGYAGIHKREEHRDREVAWHIAVRPGKHRQMVQGLCS